MRIIILTVCFYSISFIVKSQDKLYHNKAETFTIHVLENWSAAAQENNLSIQSRFGENILIREIRANGETLNDLYQRYVGDMKETEEFRAIEEGEEYIHQKRYKCFEFQIIEGHKELQGILYLTVNDDVLYSIIAMSSPKRLPTFREDFLKMIRSIKFKNKTSNHQFASPEDYLNNAEIKILVKFQWQVYFIEIEGIRAETLPYNAEIFEFLSDGNLIIKGKNNQIKTNWNFDPLNNCIYYKHNGGSVKFEIEEITTKQMLVKITDWDGTITMNGFRALK